MIFRKLVRLFRFDVEKDKAECRICLREDQKSGLIAPCECRGTMEYVHVACLDMWYANSGNLVCFLFLDYHIF